MIFIHSSFGNIAHLALDILKVSILAFLLESASFDSSRDLFRQVIVVFDSFLFGSLVDFLLGLFLQVFMIFSIFFDNSFLRFSFSDEKISLTRFSKFLMVLFCFKLNVFTVFILEKKCYLVVILAK